MGNRSVCLTFRNKIMRWTAVVVMCLLIGTLFAGCSGASTSSIYNGVLSQTEHELHRLENAAADTAKLSLGETLYNFAMKTKSFAPFVIVGSMGFGVLVLLIVRKERGIRKKVFGFFIIGIPTFMFIISYGLAILVTTYNF